MSGLLQRVVILYIICITCITCSKWNNCITTNGKRMCFKAFFKTYSISFEKAVSICSEEGALVAPMQNDQQEKVIRDAASDEFPTYSWIHEPMLLYLGAKKNESSAPFKWMNDQSEVKFHTFAESSNKQKHNHEFENCIMFEWNYEQPNFSILLEKTDCDCALPGYCRGRNRGVVCARIENDAAIALNSNADQLCPSGYVFPGFGTICYKSVVFASIGTRISPNWAQKECQKSPGGQLATIPNSKVNEYLKSVPDLKLAAFGLRCTNVTFNEDRSSCKWSDGTTFEYHNFHENNPHTRTGNECCSYTGGYWNCCAACDLNNYYGYICQAPMQSL